MFIHFMGDFTERGPVELEVVTEQVWRLGFGYVYVTWPRLVPSFLGRLAKELMGAD